MNDRFDYCDEIGLKKSMRGGRKVSIEAIVISQIKDDDAVHRDVAMARTVCI